jgi:tetratricopeptide (TPR) repeat protein
MQMSSEETSAPRVSSQSSVDVPAAADGRELHELRKEVVEARNLVIKTDNLLKNMHAEIKKMGARQDEFARRRFLSSATAYVLFAIIWGVGAFMVARSDSSQEREKSAANEAHARQLSAQVEQLQKQEVVRRDTSEKAGRIYEQLGSEKEGPGLNQAMTNAIRMDRQLLSPLEAKALEDRVASMKSAVAQAALDRGQRAYRQGDWKGASTELGRYLELSPGAAEPVVYFHVGHARAMTREWPGVIPAMEAFLKNAGGTKTAQTAGFYLGEAYEEGGNYAKASEAYSRAQALYPGSDLAPAIRAKLRRLPSLQTAAANAQGAGGAAATQFPAGGQVGASRPAPSAAQGPSGATAPAAQGPSGATAQTPR